MSRNRGRRGHGEGSIFFNESRQRWCVDVDYGYVGGKRKRVRRSFKTRKEASQWLATAQQARQSGIPAPDGRTKVGDFCDHWLANLIEPSALRPTTKTSYEAAIRLHIKPALGHLRLNDLRHHHVQSFINERRANGCGKSLMNTIMVVLRMILDQAMVEERIGRNIAKGVTVPGALVTREAPRRLTAEERIKLLAAVRFDRLFGLYFVMATFGLRRGEALGLRLVDLDVDGKLLHVRQQIVRVTGKGLVAQPPKRGGARAAFLTERSVQVLLSCVEMRNADREAAREGWVESGLLFTTKAGTALDPARVNHHMTALCAAAGIPHAAPHALRRGFADLAHDLGVGDKALQTAMGHANIAMTMDTYVGPRTTTDERFASMIDGSLGDLANPLADRWADRPS